MMSAFRSTPKSASGVSTVRVVLRLVAVLAASSAVRADPWDGQTGTSSGCPPTMGWPDMDVDTHGPGTALGSMMGGMMDMMGQGMMAGTLAVNPNNAFYVAPEPLSLAAARHALEAYVAALGDTNLVIDDLMVFDNHAYAQIAEHDTGHGVLEVLVDPTSRAVYPEMGPNMMWNLKYGMMAGFGAYGMMAPTGQNTPGTSSGMGGGTGMMGGAGGMHGAGAATLTAARAVTLAQAYLDEHLASLGLQVVGHPDPFYGYYTLHVGHGDQVTGMLSVNSLNGAVWPHTWHGVLLALEHEE